MDANENQQQNTQPLPVTVQIFWTYNGKTVTSQATFASLETLEQSPTTLARIFQIVSSDLVSAL
jgi:hypothetical protein